MRRAWPLHFVLLGILAGFGQAHADTYTVNSTLDLPDGDPTDNACATAPPAPVCTLRAAVMQANAHAGADVIEVPAGTYVLTRVGYDQTASLGDLDITDDVSIYSISKPVIIDANGSVTLDRAFEVISGALDLQGVTLKNGNTPNYGGAIYAQGALSLYDVNVLNNTAALNGGGVYATGFLHIESSTLQGNTTQGSGGGISVQSNGTGSFIMQNAEVFGNQALASFGHGGGVHIFGASAQVNNSSLHDNSGSAGGGLAYLGSSYVGLTLDIRDSVFDHNMATGGEASGEGGGLYSNVNDPLFNNTISNSEFTNNSAFYGGGIYAFSNTSLTDVTVSHNSATDGAGIYFHYGNVDMLRGRVDNNTATRLGGGFNAVGLGGFRLAITDSTVFANSAADGGGMWTGNTFTAMSSVIYGNHAGRGGGVFASFGAAVLNDSTIDGNSAGSYGGGVFADSMATVKLNSATVTGNRARANYPSPGAGAGIYVTSPASVTATASVFAYNNNSSLTPAPSDCFGTLILSDSNFISTNAGCTVTLLAGAVDNQVYGSYPFIGNPSLSALVRLYDPTLASPPNASPKFGRVPLAGSMLIDAGPPGGCKAADGSDLLWDQIGQVRALNGRCDIGAIEYGAALDEVFGNGFDG